MAAAKIQNLRVKPSQWANLCFEVGGVMGSSTVELGDTVTPFDFPTFYGNLGTTVLGMPARLKFDSAGIGADPGVTASTLCALRAEPAKAVLDKAVAARENSFYGKYANQTAVIAQTRAYYDPSTLNSKPQRLTALSTISQNQTDLLYAAYFADGRLAVVKSTTAEIRSTTDSVSETCSTTVNDGFNQSTNTGSQNGTSNTFTDNIATDIAVDIASGGVTNTISDDVSFGVATASSLASSFGSGFQAQYGVSIGRADSKGAAKQLQSGVNTDYGYRVPNLENSAQNHRAQISLMDEQFSQYMYAQNLPNLEKVFQNELSSIDLDVKRLQVSYLSTLLLSPIPGVVTGRYKNPGDRVSAGEAVVRVENNQEIYLVGILVYRGMITLSNTVTVTTTLFSATGTPPTVISGQVVAARGNQGNDDRWEVVIKCNNLDGGGNPVLPLHYSFDYDSTSATIA
jgi:biotin carboxyl carrier protein